MCEECIMYKEELRMIKDQLAAKRRTKPKPKYTCCNCQDRVLCEYAFDPYNTDGDCLAIK